MTNEEEYMINTSNDKFPVYSNTTNDSYKPLTTMDIADFGNFYQDYRTYKFFITMMAFGIPIKKEATFVAYTF